jgi:hypothetical protein
MFKSQEQAKAERDEHMEKCRVFNEWCTAKGISTPKINYPAYFEGGLVGV